MHAAFLREKVCGMQTTMDLQWLLLVYNLCMFYRILKEGVFVYLWCLIKPILILPLGTHMDFCSSTGAEEALVYTCVHAHVCM